MAEHMLTTIDNPYDPFTNFDAWYNFDVAHGYNTLDFQARVAVTANELSDADQSAAIENAIDEIVKENVLGIYRKVTATSLRS